MAPSGVAGGTTRSVIIGDEGGPLSRAALIGLGGVAAAGAVRDVKTDVIGVRSGPRPGETIVTTRTTATVDRQAAENAQGILNAATDPNTELTSRTGGLGATLEIASTKLGGDTSGWMFRFGWVYRLTRNDGEILRGLRGSAGLGFGQFTLHDRTRRSYRGLNQVEERIGDWDYNYVGVPIRAGYVIGKVLNKEAIVPYAAAEAFFQADGNLATAYGILLGESAFSPSPWHAGIRLNYYVAYAEATVSMSSMHTSERSLGLELGLGF